MNVRKRGPMIMLGIALLGLLVAAGFWLSTQMQQVEQTLYLPEQGEAGYNPLYALKQTLLADAVKVDSRQRLSLDRHRLQAADTLLLYSDPSVLLASDTRQLLDWVAAGGHLLVRTPLPGKDEDALTVPLLEEIGVQVLPLADAPNRCTALQVISQEAHVEFCRGRRFEWSAQKPELSWGDQDNGLVYARLPHGRGHVDVVADFDFLQNSSNGAGIFRRDMTRPPQGGLHDRPHRALTRNLLAPNYGQGTVHLVYAAQMPSLTRLILEKGWMVWWPLLLALLGWLWMRMQRFGPLLPQPAAARRSLLEHVRASGEHLYRYGRGALLHEAVRQSFLRRLRRRDPIAAALTGEAQVDAIARRTGVADSAIRKALQTPARDDRHGLRERISLLIQMRNQL